MMPAGVVRLIWAIAPNAEMREAMLGDLEEDFEKRMSEHGRVVARAWVWREALQSLGEVLIGTVPRVGTILTVIVPAVIWSYIVAALANLAMVVLVYPALHPLFGRGPLDIFGLVGIAPLALIAATIAGYEAARVGRASPFWSAIAFSVVLMLISIGPLRAISLWYWPVLAVFGLISAMTGAVLQQAQRHRLAANVTTYR
ncbi:MAG TPA: hypothetical protein VGM50_21525 [Gemmatimonadaceae bacterium]|jgi:hypothetical protein